MINNINNLIQKVVDTEMNGIVRKIDERISELVKIVETTTGEICVTATARVNELFTTKRLILAEQKEVIIHICKDCRFYLTKQCDVNCKNDVMRWKWMPIKTKGDVIRENNESLAEWYTEKTNNVLSQLGAGCLAEKEKVLDRLNQLQEDTNEVLHKE